MKKHLKILIGIGVTCFVVAGVVLGIVGLKNVQEDSVGTVQEHVVNTDPGKCVVSFNVGVPELVSNLGNYSDQIITKGKKMKKPKEPKCDVATFDGWGIYEEGIGLVKYDFKTPINEDTTLYAMWKMKTSDKDKDGLNDAFEQYLGMNAKNPDMDEDNVTDYAELQAGLDPNKKDSDDNGVEDGKEDSDNDGLINEEEANLGTSLIWNDSDNDGLTDLEEKELGSNPLNSDTDQDGAPDGWEIAQGYAPTKKDDAFTFTVEKASSDQSAIFSVEATASGTVAQTAQIKALGNYTNPYYNKNVPGFVSACEFYMEGNPGEVTLSVEHDLNVYLNLFYLDEGTGMFERVEDQENNGTVTTAKVDGTKTYALLDEWAYRNYKDQKNKYFDGMDVVFLVDNSGPMWEMDTIGKRQEIVNNILGSLQKDKTRVAITTYGRAVYQWHNNPASELNTDFSEVEKIMDELRCLDWEDEIYMKHQTINKFPYEKEAAYHYDNHEAYHDVSFLEPFDPGLERYIIHITDGVDDTYYSYNYDNFIVPEREYWEAIYNMSESDRQAYLTERGEDTDVEEELEAYSKMPRTLQEYKEQSYREIVQQFMDLGYKVITIGLGDANHDILKMIAEQSGGAYYHVSMDTTGEMQEEMAPETDKETDSNKDGISDYYSDQIYKGLVRPAGGNPEYIGIDFNKNPDYDGDGLLNGDEIKVIEQEPGLSDKAAGLGTVVYLEVTSNPILKDSDFDEYDDATEIATGMDPLQPSLPTSLLRQLENDSQFHSALYINDTQNKEHYQAVMEMGALISGNWDLTELYRELLVDYFCDWAERNGVETEFVESEEAFIQSSMLKLADLCNDYLERVDKWSTNEATFMLTLKDEIYEILSKSGTDQAKLEEWFFKEIGTQEVWTLSGTNHGISLYDITEKPVYETKYRKSAFSDLFEALDHINTATELVDSYVVLGKVSANHNAFVQNDEFLTAIQTTSDNPYLQKAAKQVQDSMRSEYDAAFEIMVNELVSFGIDIFVENKLADLFIGTTDSIFGFGDDIKQYYEMCAYVDMNDAAAYLMHQNLRGMGDYYVRAEGDYFNSYKQYLQHVLCTRILGEYKYLEWYNYDGDLVILIQDNVNVVAELKNQIELLMEMGVQLRIPDHVYKTGKFAEIYKKLKISY